MGSIRISGAGGWSDGSRVWYHDLGHRLQASGFRKTGRYKGIRDHRKLKAFHLADTLTLQIYKATRIFPRDEQFGLISQMRRAAVSVASNIVEGSARDSLAEYLRFLNISYGSVCELQYQISLAARLGYLKDESSKALRESCHETAKVINGLIRSLRKTSRPEA